MPQGSEYYNPIIQAMIARAGLDQQRERDVQSAKQASEDLKLRTSHAAALEKQQQQSHDLAVKKHEDEHADSLAKLEAQKLIMQGALEARKLNAIKSARELITGGVGKEALQDPGTGVNQATLPGVPDNPGIQPNLPDPNRTPEGMITVAGQHLPASAFPTPEQEAARVQSMALAKKSGEVQAEEPKRQADLEKQNQRDEANAARAERVALIQQQTQLATHKMMFDLGMSKVKNGETPNDPIEDSNAFQSIYYTGNTDIKSMPAKQRLDYQNKAPKGYQPIDPKDKTKLDNVNTIQEILKLGAELADNSYDKNPTGALKALIGTGEVQAKRDQLKSLAGNLAEVFGKEGSRKTDADIKRATEGLYNPRLSSADNLKKVQEADKIFSQDILKPLFSKYSPEQLKGILANRGIDPDLAQMDSHPNVKGSSGTVKIQSPDGQTLDVPASKKDYYIKKGGKVVE